jgi:GT2 family glycosyltransferase
MVDRLSTSVVIVAKDAQDTIGRTLAALFQNTVAPDEVLIVVDNPRDPTVTALDAYPVRVVISRGGGVGAARKVGVDASSGEVIVFIDADSIPHPRLIEAYETTFREMPAVRVQAGRVVPYRAFDRADPPTPRLGVEGTVEFAETMKLALRRQVIDAIGNFSERYRIGGEDLDFCLRLKKGGVAIHRNPRAIVYHLPSNRPWAGLRRDIRNGQSRAHVFLEHGFAAIGPAVTALLHTALIAATLVLGFSAHTYMLVPLLLSLGHRSYRFVSESRRSTTTRVRSRMPSSLLLKHFVFIYLSYFAFIYVLLRSFFKRPLSVSPPHAVVLRQNEDPDAD